MEKEIYQILEALLMPISSHALFHSNHSPEALV